MRPISSRSIPLTSFLALALLGPALLAEQPADKDSVFTLGQVEVTGTRDLPIEARADVLSSEKISSFQRQNLASALNLLPGVTTNQVAGRNEIGVYVRGFDLRQVPLFIDGIPVYVPYDGYVDLARFTTADVSQISVSKGFSSVLYGANALGGAINVVSRRPQRALEVDAGSTVFSGNGRAFDANIGAKRGQWYGQVGASYLSQDFYRVSDNFHPVGVTEDGGRRENSSREDKKVSAKVGFTPNATDEYAIGFSQQQGEKDTPPYAGTDPTVKARFWRWPQWDKTDLYFISTTALGSESYLKPRFYYDTFKNQLFAYDNATYTTQSLGSSFRSIYNDYTYGGSLELGTMLLPRQTLKAATHYKLDVHREHNVGSPETKFSDRTWSFALEDTFRATDQLSAVGGVSFEGRQSVQAQNLTGTVISDFPGNRNDTLNPELGLFYALTPASTLELSVARKSRFPTVKDRYSYRLGQALPNPGLVPEHALHYELAYRGKPVDKVTFQASVFLSKIDDTIQRVDRVAFATNGAALFQLQNIGETENRGAELGGDYTPFAWLRAGANYTYLDRENKTSPGIRLIDTPDHKAFTFVEIKPVAKLTLLSSYEYDSSRFSTSYGVKAGSYALVNFKASYEIYHGFEISGGVNNIFDKAYQLTEGYPEEGRNLFASLTYHF